MGQDLYMKRIDELLREIPSLERHIDEEQSEERRNSLVRSLKARKKRFEHLIPFAFRQELRCICQRAGVSGSFQE